MKEKIFLIDIDGVACEHAKAICERVNQDYNLKSEVEDVKSWAHDFGGITFTQAVKQYYPNDKFILEMEVTPQFRDFLDYLEKKMLVKFATSRIDSHDATRKWIDVNFGSNFEIIFSKCKIHEKFDYLIDDHLPEIICAADRDKPCFLFRRPWNDNEETRSLLKKHYNLAHFVDSFIEVQEIVNNL